MIDSYKLKNYPFILIICILILNIIGVLVISSATYGDMRLVGKQILGIVIGMTLMIGISIIPYRKILNFSILIYIFCIAILIAVIVFGYEPSGAGAKRWIILPGIGQIQPSEFVKIGLILFLSWLLSKYNDFINDIRYLLVLAGLVGLSCILIMAEPDLSTTVVVVIFSLGMIFAAGISYKWILGALAVAIPSVCIFLYLLSHDIIPFLRGYQARRILAWVNPAEYADANLQQDNSIMAIGSGQLIGKGLNNNTLASVKNGNFLSQEQTDFIFAVIGEELGFVGCATVIILFALVVYICLYLAQKCADLEGKLICTGFAMLVAFQSFTNIAVATGLFPNTGLPLPFISYGVSSLISLYIGAGVVLNVGLSRKKT